MKGLQKLFWLVLLVCPLLASAVEVTLLDEAALAAKLQQQADYQLLDARGDEAQRLASIAFSTRYRINTAIKTGLVLVVADTDAEAVKVAVTIPAAVGREVYAVQGGEPAWKRVALNMPIQSGAASKIFVIPHSTCEQGKPLQEVKRNSPLQQFQKY